MTSIGKIDTFDLMMIIRWITNITSRSTKLQLTSISHTIQHGATKIKKINEITNYFLDTLPIEYTQQAFTNASRIFPYIFNASEQTCMITIMRGSTMHEAEHDHKAIMYAAYGTHHRLYTIRRNKIQPTKNPSDQSKLHIRTQFKWGAGYHSSFVDLATFS